MRNRMKRMIAMVMALLLVLGMMPAAALADPPAGACSGEDAAARNNGQHFWNNIGTQNVSCTEDGGILYQCAYCGQTYLDKTENALGHAWGQWDIIDSPTCEEEGQRERWCTRPGCAANDVEELPPTGHKWDNGVVTKPASYTEEGIMTYTCQNDPSHTRTESIPKLDPTPTPAPTAAPTQAPTQAAHTHTWGEWKTDTSVHASCTQREMQYRVCSDCGETEYRYAGYGDHDWGEWEIVTPATETEPGLERRTCRNDSSHTEEREIPPTGAVLPQGTTEGALEISVAQTGTVKPAYVLDDILTFDVTITNTGSVTLYDVALVWVDSGDPEGYNVMAEMAPGAKATVSVSHQVYPWHIDEGQAYYYTYAFGATVPGAYNLENRLTPNPGTENVVQSNTVEISLPTGTASAIEGAALSLDVHLSPRHPAQEVYETGDYVYLEFTATNTGSVPLNGVNFYHATGKTLMGMYTAVLAPGQSESFWIAVNAYNNDNGKFTMGVMAVGFAEGQAEIDHYSDATATGKTVTSNTDYVSVPLKVKDTPRPELTLTDVGDSPAKDVYDPDEGVYAYFNVVNTGNVTLAFKYHVLFGNGQNLELTSRVQKQLAPGESINKPNVGHYPIGEVITPGTETEELAGTVDMTMWVSGHDPETGEELCSTGALTRSWKVRKAGPDEWEIPEESRLEVSQQETSASADPNGYQVGENLCVDQFVTNNGPVPMNYTISYQDTEGWGWELAQEGLQPGDVRQYHNWSEWTMKEEDAERGYFHVGPVKVTWIDPDSGKEHTAWSNDLAVPVIKKDGPFLRVDKRVANRPANGQYFTTGETIQWSLTITNTGTETMTYIHVWDEETGCTEIDAETLAPGQSTTVPLPSNYVDENIVMTLDSYGNMAVVTAVDGNGGAHEYAGFAWAPLSPKGAKDHPLDNGKEDTDGKADPGQPETPDHPGTPGGGEDPMGLPWGIIASATIYKTVDGMPANGEYYEQGETIRYAIIVKNTGDETLDSLSVYDSLAGFAPIGEATGLEPGAERPFEYVYTVTQADIDRGYVVNRAMMRYSYSGINSLPVQSNPVYSIAGENGFIPLDIIPGGEDGTELKPWQPGTPGGGWFDPAKLPGGGKHEATPEDEPICQPGGTPFDVPDGMQLVPAPDGGPVYCVPVETRPVFRPDHVMITGPDGLPVYAPEGTEPVTGPDGIPVMVPADVTVTTPDGKPVVIPAGTPVLKLPGGEYGVLLPDGSIIATDEYGNPILDGDGNLIYIGQPGLHGLDSLNVCCELRLDSVGSTEVNYTLHACANHLKAAQAAEAAAAAGTAEGWKQAADIWREEISELYGILAEAGDEPAKAAVLYDITMFYAYLESYEKMNLAADEAAVQKTIAEMLRLRCAELCCAIHTAPARLPDSLLNGYALTEDKGGTAGREISALNGSDAALTERFAAPGARTLSAVMDMMNGLKTPRARANAFVKAQAAWQTSLDRIVNAGYKAADKESRKAIAACRKALDLMISAHKAVLEILYAEAPDVAEEAVASMYRNALLDAGTVFGAK